MVGSAVKRGFCLYAVAFLFYDRVTLPCLWSDLLCGDRHLADGVALMGACRLWIRELWRSLKKRRVCGFQWKKIR